MDELKTLNEVITLVNEGDYLTALTMYEDQVRPNTSVFDNTEYQTVFTILNDLNTLIDEEDWQSVLDTVVTLEQEIDKVG